jgi:hypothetical protein
MLTTSIRTLAFKVLILLTDGCQNHLFNPDATPMATNCPCGGEAACATDPVCLGDLTTWHDWVVAAVPGVKIIVVGVGTSDTICYNQLVLAAGGDSTNVYNPQSWTELADVVDTITATACSVDVAPCVGCCGICTCGTCIPATECADASLCSLGVKDSTSCCTYQDVVCDPQPCFVQSCDPAIGCVYDPIICPANPDICNEYYCNDTTVTCAVRNIDPPPGSCTPSPPPPQCDQTNVNVNCDDNNLCTEDLCKPDGSCDWTDISSNCEINNNRCSFSICTPDKGCVTTLLVCDDKNNCTIDSCNPSTGCVFTPRTCTPSPNYCVFVDCDPQQGCFEYPNPCSNLTAANCTVPDCNGTCYDKFICVVPVIDTSTEGPPPTTIIVAATLGTAAVAGIIVAGVIAAVALGGGAAFAIAQAGAAGTVAMTASNPIFKPPGTDGDNPLHKG